MFRLTLAALGLLPILAGAAFAQQSDVDRLYDALGLPQTMEIMREEGIVYGDEIGADLLAGRAGADFTAGVSAIYDVDVMERESRAALARALEGEDLGPMLDFYTSEPGPRLVALEIAAREAMLEEDVDAAAREAAALEIAEGTERFRLIDAVAEANDLIETNIVGAMNANYAFYMGLMDGGALPAALTEDQILADVWMREPELRQSTTEWVYSYLLLAYEPATEADVQAYLDFSQTPAGQVLNQAVFESFDGMFVGISRALGLLSAQVLLQQDL